MSETSHHERISDLEKRVSKLEEELKEAAEKAENRDEASPRGSR
jgi:hypothetical protein